MLGPGWPILLPVSKMPRLGACLHALAPESSRRNACRPTRKRARCGVSITCTTVDGRKGTRAASITTRDIPRHNSSTGTDLERNYMVEALQQLGIDVRPLMRPTSRKPYPDWIDRVHQFPKGYKVPEFVLFFGEEKKSTIEHIARFSVQCGEARSKDYLKLRLFANSLTKSAFPWYMNIPPHSINSWYDLESKFHP